MRNARFGFVMNADEQAALARLAKDEAISKADIVRRLIREATKNHDADSELGSRTLKRFNRVRVGQQTKGPSA